MYLWKIKICVFNSRVKFVFYFYTHFSDSQSGVTLKYLANSTTPLHLLSVSPKYHPVGSNQTGKTLLSLFAIFLEVSLFYLKIILSSCWQLLYKIKYQDINTFSGLIFFTKFLLKWTDNFR
jgi:hypothetical protein